MSTRVLLPLMMVLALAMASRAWAQINAIPFPRLLPKKASVPAAPTAQPKAADQYHRLMEILIELAWLADPATFPLQLEARVDGGTVHLRGKVPDEKVRAQAAKLARLHCPMNISDELTTTAAAPANKSMRVDAPALQQRAQSAVYEAFPSGSHRFRISCDPNGMVTIDGRVNSFADKLAVSKKLQRLHGCACVANQLEVGPTAPPSGPGSVPAMAEPNQPLVRVRKKQHSRFRTLLCLPGRYARDSKPAAPAPLPTATASRAPARFPLAAPATGDGLQSVSYTAPAAPVAVAETPPPRLEFQPGTPPVSTVPDRPFETRGVVILPDNDPAAMSAHQLKESIFRKCGPAAHDVGVKFKSPTEVEICLRARSPADAARLAHLIMQIPELMTYRVDIRVKLIR